MSEKASSKLSLNVLYLMLAQACFSANSMTFISFAGLAGTMIASDPAFATLPVSLSMVVVALSTAPLSMLMQRHSRKTIFLICALSGVVGAMVAAAGLFLDSFVLLCVATLFLGPFQASAQYYRFAAAESVSTSSAPRAISYVLVGGIVAALVTPTGSAFFNDLFLPYFYVGAFVFSALLCALALVPLSLLKRPGKARAAAGQEEASEEAEETARPLAKIARQPAFIAAVANGALGYAMMVFVMTATPIAMVDYCGFSGGESAQVIAWHVIAMFLPSLFTGSLIARIGLLPVLFAGHGLFAAAFLLALGGIEIFNFSAALIALGVGWNFCFVGGTTLLTQVHKASERGRVQGLNEVLVFGSSALASLAAGAILRFFGWTVVNQAAFVLLLLAFCVTLFWVMQKRTDSQAMP